MNTTQQTQEQKDGRDPALREATGSVAYALFEHMAREHHLTLIGYEIDEIIRVVNSALEERLRWWISNAEQIAKERGVTIPRRDFPRYP